MALWKEVLNLNSEDTKEVCLSYSDAHCPIEVRSYCAHWIEEEINKGTDPVTFYRGLVQQLKLKSASLLASEPFYVRYKLSLYIDFVEKTYANNPAALLQIITRAVQKEYELVKRSEQRGNRLVANVVTNSNAQYQDMSSTIRNNQPVGTNISDSLQAAKKNSCDTDAVLKKINEELQLANLNVQDIQLCKAAMNELPQQVNSQITEMDLKMDLQRLQTALNENLKTISSFKIYFEQVISALIMDLSKIMAQVLDDELKRWSMAQYLYGTDAIFTDIDVIQRWVEELVDLIWATREQLKYASQLRFPVLSNQTNGVRDNFTVPLNTCTRLLTELLKKSLIVHSIPSQVLKTATRFPFPYNVTVKFLIGGKLNVCTTPLPVQLELINETTAKNLNDKDVLGKPNGVLLNNKGRMEYNRASGDFSAVFKSLKTVSREKPCSTSGEGGGNDLVTREKFYLIATTEVVVTDLKLKLSALSPPLVVISHGNQEASAWATVIWTNIFSKGHPTQDVPLAVPWSQFAELLDQFTARTLGKGLSQDNLQFLKQKAPIKDGMVKLSDITKNLPELDFSFWEWVFKAVKLIEKEKHLKELWVDGHITGFIIKKYGEQLLQTCTPGNFLIRISETILGALTFSWIEKNGQVYSMEPMTCNSLKIQTLAEKVRDLDSFDYLYPEIPKDVVFKKYYEVIPESSVLKPYQYVKPFMMLTLKGAEFSSGSSTRNNSLNGSCSGNSPNTPQSVTTGYNTDNDNSPYPWTPETEPLPMDIDEWLVEMLQCQSTSPLPECEEITQF